LRVHGCFRSRSGDINQRALPDQEQKSFELGEVLGPELLAPLPLDVQENLEDLRVGGASAFGEADNPRAAFIGIV
jgi:hypothetical protein